MYRQLHEEGCVGQKFQTLKDVDDWLQYMHSRGGFRGSSLELLRPLFLKLATYQQTLIYSGTGLESTMLRTFFINCWKFMLHKTK